MRTLTDYLNAVLSLTEAPLTAWHWTTQSATQWKATFPGGILMLVPDPARGPAAWGLSMSNAQGQEWTKGQPANVDLRAHLNLIIKMLTDFVTAKHPTHLTLTAPEMMTDRSKLYAWLISQLGTRLPGYTGRQVPGSTDGMKTFALTLKAF